MILYHRTSREYADAILVGDFYVDQSMERAGLSCLGGPGSAWFGARPGRNRPWYSQPRCWRPRSPPGSATTTPIMP